MNQIRNDRPCPMCDASAPRIRSVRKSNTIHRYAKCSVCGFLYLLEPREDTISHGADSTTDTPHVRHRILAQLLELWSAFPHESQYRVVEIGAGTGIVGQLLKKNADVNYVGYEPSQSRARIAQAHGVDVRCAFYEPKHDEQLVDCFIFDNVLEHVMGPREMVRESALRLSRGGRMIIIVPGRYDIRRLSRKWRDRHYWQPHCHVNHFRRSDVALMMQSAGLSVRSFPMNAVLKSTKSITWRARFLVDRFLSLFGIYLVGEKR